MSMFFYAVTTPLPVDKSYNFRISQQLSKLRHQETGPICATNATGYHRVSRFENPASAVGHCQPFTCRAGDLQPVYDSLGSLWELFSI